MFLTFSVFFFYLTQLNIVAHYFHRKMETFCFHVIPPLALPVPVTARTDILHSVIVLLLADQLIQAMLHGTSEILNVKVDIALFSNKGLNEINVFWRDSSKERFNRSGLSEFYWVSIGFYCLICFFALPPPKFPSF